MKFRIQDKEIDTDTQEGKITFGNYYEQKLFKYLKNNPENNFKMVSNTDIYSLYDFIDNTDEKNIRIIELRSRIGNIKNFKFDIFDIKKYDRLINLLNNDNIKDIYIYFGHIEPNNYKEFKFYSIDIRILQKLINDDEIKKNIYYKKNMYEIPIKFLNPIEF